MPTKQTISRWPLLGVLLLAGCGGGGTDPDPEPATGELQVLTYNVAGLPEGISSSHPAEYTPQISPLLNGYPLVLVQEDFYYHDDLAAAAEHPHRSIPEPEEPDLANMDLGDGLNRFADSAFTDHARHPWTVCNGQLDSGSDCLTPKGFAVASHDLAPGVTVDVYNFHMDASGSEADQQARASQVEQLLAEIAARSPDRAIVVAGDTNLKPAQRELDATSFDRLLDGAGLTDACRTLACGDEARIDRVLFRGSAQVTLTPLDWALPTEFVTATGEPLSDHEPVTVTLSWTGLAEESP